MIDLTEHYDLYKYVNHEWEFVTTYKMEYSDDHWSAINSMRTTMIEDSTRAGILFHAIKSSVYDWQATKIKVYRSRDQHEYILDPNHIGMIGMSDLGTHRVCFVITEKHGTGTNDMLLIQPDYNNIALHRACRWIA